MKSKSTVGESTDSARPDESNPLQRLQRALAHAGLGSRRACEQLITAGRVAVDGRVVTELGTKVDPTRQAIAVDGEALRIRPRVYFMLNKPVGVLSTNRDESGRPRTIDLVPTDERVYSVGRLDKSSEGLILLTNDGELAQRLTHPRHGVTKTYLVRVVGQPTIEQLNQLKSGVRLAEGIARVAAVRLKKSQKHFSELEMILDEGRNREIRRVLAAIGHKVVALKRIAIGPLRLGDLPSGASRRLERREVAALRAAATGGGVSGTAVPGAGQAHKPRSGPSRKARPVKLARREKPGNPLGARGKSTGVRGKSPGARGKAPRAHGKAPGARGKLSAARPKFSRARRRSS